MDAQCKPKPAWQPDILIKWTNWFFGLSWGDDAISIAIGPVAFSWER